MANESEELEETVKETVELTPPPAPPAHASPSTTSDENTALLKELITQTKMQRETVETLMNRVDSVVRYLQQTTSEMQETMQSMREVMELSEKTLVENDQQTERLGTAVRALVTAEQNLTALYQAAMEDEPLPDEQPAPDEEP